MAILYSPISAYPAERFSVPARYPQALGLGPLRLRQVDSIARHRGFGLAPLHLTIRSQGNPIKDHSPRTQYSTGFNSENQEKDMWKYFLILCKATTRKQYYSVLEEAAQVLDADPAKAEQDIAKFLTEIDKIKAKEDESRYYWPNFVVTWLMGSVFGYYSNWGAEMIFAYEISTFCFHEWGKKRHPIFHLMIGIPTFICFKGFALLCEPWMVNCFVALSSALLVSHIMVSIWTKLR